jgi:hypothetical protein
VARGKTLAGMSLPKLDRISKVAVDHQSPLLIAARSSQRFQERFNCNCALALCLCGRHLPVMCTAIPRFYAVRLALICYNAETACQPFLGRGRVLPAVTLFVSNVF